MKYFGLAIYNFDTKNANYTLTKRLQSGKKRNFFEKNCC